MKYTLIPVLAVLILAACATNTRELQASRSVPAAAGKVTAKEGRNGNTELDLKVEHLARPSAVSSDTTTYVVWAKDEDSGQVSNLGALAVDKNLRGRLKTVTPMRNFDLFITPETRSAEFSPTGERLLWTQIRM